MAVVRRGGKVVRRGGKKNRKHGRNGRKPGSKRQAERTAKNKAQRMLREEMKAGRRLAWNSSDAALRALDQLR